jgi:glycosyltransferase involved in cell wall biosynthesis
MDYHLGFVMEQVTGHITHHLNLARRVAEDPAVCPTWIPIPYRDDDLWSRLPLVRRNWSLLLSLRARQRVGWAARHQPLDGLFYHTQVTALCSLGLMRRVPTVVSLDATPLNMDSVGAGYCHRAATAHPVDQVKFRWNRALFRAATALTTWSCWARDSLVRDYSIAAEKIAVIPPGVDLDEWRPGDRGGARVPRLLFVGGDFTRKGGSVLLEAFRAGLSNRCELDVVTRDPTLRSEGPLRVHRGLAPNDPALKRLYREADLFVLPTLGDCTPLSILEAMASGLAVVATRIGAIAEEVEHGVTGLLVPPGDAAALAEAVAGLVDDPPRRRACAVAARRRAERLFDAGRNYPALIDLVKQCAEGRARRASAPHGVAFSVPGSGRERTVCEARPRAEKDAGAEDVIDGILPRH